MVWLIWSVCAIMLRSETPAIAADDTMLAPENDLEHQSPRTLCGTLPRGAGKGIHPGGLRYFYTSIIVELAKEDVQ